MLASPLLLIRTLNQFNRVYLFAIGWERKQLIPQVVAIVLKILLGVLLVPQWGVNGLIGLSIAVDGVLLAGYVIPVYKHARANLGVMP